MSKNNNIVYSTNPNFNYDNGEEEPASSSGNQNLWVHFERKHRAGKKVTLVERFAGSSDELKELGALLKKKCGVGGTAKDGIILIQGDHCDKIKEILLGMGYKVKG